MSSNDEDLFKRIFEAWKSGRSIVPVIGAGASADSGFPPLASVVRYIAKLKCYLQHKLYLPTPGSESLFSTHVEKFAKRADEYVSIFGWPDRFQLNAELRDRLGNLDKDSSPKKEWIADSRYEAKGLLDMALCTTLDELANEINPGGFWHLQKLP